MKKNLIPQSKILLIDDEKINIRLLEIILQEAGYTNVYSTTDSRESLALFRSIRPDIVLLDLNMPYLDGFEVMQQLAQEIPDHVVPILVLTADAVVSTKHRALRNGASDFLTKPLDDVEVLLRINNLLESHFYKTILESKVQERTQELEIAQMETLQRLASAAECRDDDTGLHTKRVGNTAASIAEILNLPQRQVELIRLAAPLHDVGKIGIPDFILLKPGKLTSEEFTIMKQHTLIGAKMLSNSTSLWLGLAEEIARSHHERWDGNGYPHQLSGEDIPLVGRIVAVADVFDALTHERPYKNAWSVNEALSEIEAQSTRHFDEQVVKAFLTLPHNSLL